MARGRPSKSPGERRIEGNPGKRPIPIEVFTPEGVPFVPDHLSEDAQVCAEFIIASFKTKRLTAPDSYLLSAFAAAWAWHKAAVHAMNAPDFKAIVPGAKGGQVPNPWFKILGEQARTMIALSAKLYLSPADRASIKGAGEERPRSKFDGLIGRTGSSPSLSN